MTVPLIESGRLSAEQAMALAASTPDEPKSASIAFRKSTLLGVNQSRRPRLLSALAAITYGAVPTRNTDCRSFSMSSGGFSRIAGITAWCADSARDQAPRSTASSG